MILWQRSRGRPHNVRPGHNLSKSLFRWRSASRTENDVRKSAVFPDGSGSSWQFPYRRDGQSRAEFGICRVVLSCPAATYHIDECPINPFTWGRTDLRSDTMSSLRGARDHQMLTVRQGRTLGWRTSTTRSRHSAEARHEVPSV